MPGLVSELISDIKIKGQLQADATVLSDADILSIANKELQSVIVPKILSVRENYFWCFKEYQIAGAKAYRIPPRAIGSKITAITIRENTGKVFSLARKHPGDLSSRVGYKIVGDNIWIANVNGDIPSGVLRIEYQCAPPLMVLSPTTALTTVASVSGSTINTTTPLGGSYEIIRPSGSQTTVCFISGPVGTVFTNPDDLSGETYSGIVVAGDEVISTNASHRVPLPLELHDWLAQRCVMRIKEYLGHSDEMSLAGAKLADMERDGLAIITPRSEQDEKVISDKEILNWRTW
jgi:hypothetical protein